MQIGGRPSFLLEFGLGVRTLGFELRDYGNLRGLVLKKVIVAPGSGAMRYELLVFKCLKFAEGPRSLVLLGAAWSEF